MSANKNQYHSTLTGPNTTFKQRFADAVAILCGAEPPDDLIDEWLANIEINGEHRLQSWVCEQAHTPTWAQSIVILDAAHVLAASPVEGEDHKDRGRNHKESHRG